MRSTEPVAGECMGTETKPPASAIGSPRTTSCPSRTIGMAGAPVCWERGTTSIGAKAMRRIGRWLVCSLCSGTCTPRQKCLPGRSPNRDMGSSSCRTAFTAGDLGRGQPKGCPTSGLGGEVGHMGTQSVVFRRPLEKLVEILLFGVPGTAGMDHLRSTLLRGTDQIFVRAALRVLHVSVFVGVVSRRSCC